MGEIKTVSTDILVKIFNYLEDLLPIPSDLLKY